MSDPEEGPIGPKGQLATPAFLAAIICCGSLLLSVVPIWHLPTPKQRNGGAHTPSLMLPAHCTRCIVFLVLVAALRYSILAYLESLATLHAGLVCIWEMHVYAQMRQSHDRPITQRHASRKSFDKAAGWQGGTAMKESVHDSDAE
eukprot:1133438-Pelagomonas_calceolata.AAC.9